MDSVSLNSFISLTEEQSFTKAAAKLNITQPALSKRISALEEKLGSKLINRLNKQVTLTQAGEQFLAHAQNLIIAMDNCQTDIANLNNKTQGQLKLGVSHHIGLHRLPHHLKTFTQNYPEVKLQISFVDSEKAYDMINKGELDIAIATLAPPLKESVELKHIHEQLIWHDPLSFVASPNHELVHKKASPQLTLKKLSHYPAILPGQSTYTGKLVHRLFSETNTHLNDVIETNYLETIKMMTNIGLGWSVLPKSMLDKEICELNINNIQLSRKLGIITNTRHVLSNASQTFIKLLSHNTKSD